MNERTNCVLALTADLIFAARIRAASADVSVILARDVEDFLTKARELQPRLIVLDLDRRGLEVERVVRDLKAHTTAAVLAYASHVREDLIAAARAAGADRVMARGAFAKQLPQLLRAQ